MARISSASVGAEARRAAARAATDGREWLEKLGRLGFAAKGVVYFVVGAMALRAAIGTGRTTGSQGALEQIARQPLGEALLWIVALGLIGYAAWRFVQAARDTEHVGAETKGVLTRVGQAVSGVIHLSLALAAVRIAEGGAARDGAAEQGLVAELMSKPFGPWLVMLSGAVVAGVAIHQFRLGYTASFRKHLRTQEMDADEQKWAVRAGRAGYAARGIAFLVVGALVFVAGRAADPQRAQGLGEALQTLEQQPLGPWLLALVGLGLCCYAVFQFVLVRYRRMVLS